MRAVLTHLGPETHLDYKEPAPVVPGFAPSGPSPSILGPAATAFLVVVSALLVAVLFSGCSSVSQAEYRALVEAATSYRDAVAPEYRGFVQSRGALPADDPRHLPAESVKSRLGLDDDFQAARPSWEKRAGIGAKPECPDEEMAPGGNFYVCTGPPCLLFFWVGPHAHEGAVVRAPR